jgi:hypothetical protein
MGQQLTIRHRRDDLAFASSPAPDLLPASVIRGAALAG